MRSRTPITGGPKTSRDRPSGCRASSARGTRAVRPGGGPVSPELDGLEIGAPAGDAAVPDARGRRGHGAKRPRGVEPRHAARSAAANRTWRSSPPPPTGCSSAAAAPRAGASSRSPARSASTATARASRRLPAATASTGSTRATCASATSRRTTPGARPARSCPLWMEWRRCRWTRPRFRRAIE